MNDNKLSAERNSPSEPSVTVMEKVILLKLQTLPERSEGVMRNTSYCTEDYSFVAAPCTKIITVSHQRWTPA
ncbi:MAG: hypothetical protein ILA24_06555 [Ruminococcus sp.]|nr:hypothetical protein [Ruminococcus sp.]